MYRTNAQSRAIEEAFVRYGIPYRLVGAVRFYERREVKDVIAYLKLIHNPYDSVSLMRIINVPGRGIGQRTMDELSQWTKNLNIPLYTGLERIAEDKSSSPFASRATLMLTNFFAILKELIEESERFNVVELLDSVLKRSGYSEYIVALEDGEERWDNILELRGVAKEYEDLEPGEGLASFLEGVTLVSEADAMEEKQDVVTLITLHQAKGLEFPVVFIVGMEEGVLPHFKSSDDPAQMEEERRLCYVGMTRAEKRLYLVRAFRRSLMGGSNSNPPSRFLEDIPPHLVKSVGLFESVEVSSPAHAISPQSGWKVSSSYSPPPVLEVGDYVRHAKFGMGVVISSTPNRGDQEVVVSFVESGEKKLLLSMAPMEKIE